MNKEVVVTIRGIHGTGEAQEKTESVCRGAYFEKGDVCHILYEEKDPDGDGITKGRIKISQKCVEVERRGLVESLLIFEAGKTHKSDYRSPFGIMGLEVYTYGLSMELREDLVLVESHYRMSIDAGEARESKISIRIEGA